jgi:hypothetical protein
MSLPPIRGSLGSSHLPAGIRRACSRRFLPSQSMQAGAHSSVPVHSGGEYDPIPFSSTRAEMGGSPGNYLSHPHPVSVRNPGDAHSVPFSPNAAHESHRTIDRRVRSRPRALIP